MDALNSINIDNIDFYWINEYVKNIKFLMERIKIGIILRHRDVF
jgi:hypothetical protein